MPDALAGTRPPPDPATDPIEFLPLPAWVAAPDGRCAAVNRPWREYTGQTPEQAAGRGWLAALHPDDATAAAERWTRAVAAGVPFEAELRIRRHDGTHRWHLARSTPARGPDGRVTRWIGVLTDVDHLKQTAEASAADARRFRAVVECGADAVELLAADGTVLYASPGVARVGGRTPDERVGRSGFEWAHPDDLVALGEASRSLFAHTGATVTGEFRFQHRDGSWGWAEATGTNLLHDPAVGAVVVRSRNVTARHEADAAARRTVELLRAVVDGTTDAVFVKDRAGKYLLFNEAAARFVGRPVEEVIGLDDTALFDPASAAVVMAIDRRVMAAGRPVTEEEVLTAGGVTRTYQATKAPWRDERGVVVGLVGISRDITDRKRAEADAVEWKARYEAAVTPPPS